MRLVDIHSHILPGVDDGSPDVETSVKLLEMCKEQGITDIVATPHFDASVNNIEEFEYSVSQALSELKAAVDESYPNIYTGCEVFYFKGIGKSRGIRSLTLCGSRYILLELPHTSIDSTILKDISDISEVLGLIPIIAHIERYAEQKGFKDLLKLLATGVGYAQINAAAVLSPAYKRTVKKLMKRGYISFIATDTHSPVHRPPLMREALDEVAATFGEDYRDMFIKNTEYFYNTAVGRKENTNEK